MENKMKGSIQFIKTESSIILNFGGRTFTISRADSRYSGIAKALEDRTPGKVYEILEVKERSEIEELLKFKTK